MEIWKDIPNYEGLYQASNMGRIRSIRQDGTNRRGAVLRGKGRNRRTGYRVDLWKDKKPKSFLVARLVAETFLGKPKEGYTVNHMDGNRFNNAIGNLEWLSLGDNIRHGFKTGLYSKQKPVRLRAYGYEYEFPSMAMADVFLGRAKGYLHETIKFDRVISDVNGVIYEVVFV